MAKQKISKTKADELIKEGKAVRSGSPEHLKMKKALWLKVAQLIVFVATLNKWVLRNIGTDKGALDERAAQKKIDSQVIAPKLTISYGLTGEDKSTAYVERETPKLRDAARLPYDDVRSELIVDVMDTRPLKKRVFDENGLRVFNMWSPSKFKASKPEKYREPAFFLDVVDLIFGSSQQEKDYFLDWATHLVCHPDIKMTQSVIITSKAHGVGKGLIAEALKFMVGPQNFKMLTSDVLKGSFQSFVPGTILGCVPELYEHGNKSLADKLKPLQTESELYINLKCGPEEKVHNYLHILAFSNHDTPINISAGDRRWWMFKSEAKKPDAKFFQERFKYLKDPKNSLPHTGALMSLRYYFERRFNEMRATGRFNPYGDPPVTEAKQQVIEDSRSFHYSKLREAMAEITIPLDDQGLTSSLQIDECLKEDFRYSPPGNVQRRSDMEDLGWEKKKTSEGLQRWKAPEEYWLAYKAERNKQRSKLDI